MNMFMDAIDGSYCKYEGQENPTGGKIECGVFEPTNVVSVSYGVEEHYYPQPWQERQCNEYDETPIDEIRRSQY
jgi:tripeptidyl-peptidase I